MPPSNLAETIGPLSLAAGFSPVRPVGDDPSTASAVFSSREAVETAGAARVHHYTALNPGANGSGSATGWFDGSTSVGRSAPVPGRSHVGRPRGAEIFRTPGESNPLRPRTGALRRGV